MKLYYENTNVSLYQGDMLKVLDTFEEDSIDCIITDPPYELNFMNKGWDNTGIVFNVETWKKCLRVLKPGGYLLCFGATRIFHRVFCAIEDAGFEIRDTIMWLYGSGFPKSMNIGKAIEGKLTIGSANVKDIKKLDGEKTKVTCGFNKTGKETGYRDKEYEMVKTEVNYHTDLGKQWSGWGTALKPAYEPIMVARKPVDGSITDNVLKNGVGGFNIDECRIPLEDGYEFKQTIRHPRENAVFTDETCGFKAETNTVASANPEGRFPANTILTYDESNYEEVCGGMPYTKNSGAPLTMPDLRDVGKKSKEAIGIDKLSFGQVSGAKRKPYVYAGREYNNNKDTSMFNGDKPQAPSNYNDEGSASRYFKNCEYDDNDLEDVRRYYYCPKASKKDRNEGILGKRNMHPTVKPSSLLRYLIRLVAPKNAIILDPFNGSGSTGKACMLENRERDTNYKYIGIDLSEEYLDISKARIEWALDGDISIILNNGDQPDDTADAATPVIKKNKLW